MTSLIHQLAKRGHRSAKALDAFNPDQPRDERGRWGEGGSVSLEHADMAARHSEAARGLTAQGQHYAATLHSQAALAHTQASNAAKWPKSDKEAVGVVSESRKAAYLATNNANKAANEVQPAPKSGPTPATLGAQAVRRDDEARSSARTMTELPAITETPSRELAVSQKIPAGKERPVMGSDPNRTTQKELPALPESTPSAKVNVFPRSRETIRESVERGGRERAARMSTPGERDAKERLKASITQQLGGGPYGKLQPEGQEPSRFNAGPSDPVHGGSGRSQPYNSDVNKEYGGRGTKSSRQEAAAASAGQWASKALKAARQPYAKRKP